jgi:transketolase
MIIMDTQKSHGYIPGENSTKNHSMAFNEQQAKEAVAALYAREGVKA